MLGDGPIWRNGCTTLPFEKSASALYGGDHVLHAQQAAYGDFIQVHPCIPFLP